MTLGVEEEPENLEDTNHVMIISNPIYEGMEDSFRELLNQIRTHKVLGVDDFDLEGVLPEGFLEKIIYGQQRLGKKDDSKDECFDESASTRPYLFEAWEVREKRKIEKPLMNWRFSALKNEIDMKDNLK